MTRAARTKNAVAGHRPGAAAGARVGAMNARGVFHSVGEFGERAPRAMRPSWPDALEARASLEDDDEATLLYNPARAVTTKRTSRPARPVISAEVAIPKAPRAPALTLESVPARAPAPTESTPALTFDAESGEYLARAATTVRPPAFASRKESKLPFFAGGALALAAGALVVLLAGGGKKSYPSEWHVGAAAQPIAANTNLAPVVQAPAPVEPVYMEPVQAPVAVVAPVVVAPVVVAPEQEPAVTPTPKSTPVAKSAPVVVKSEPVAKSAPVAAPVAKAEPVKPAKAEPAPEPVAKKGKKGNAGDEEVSNAREAASEAGALLGDSL